MSGDPAPGTVAAVFVALADPSRRLVVGVLAAHGVASATAIAEELAITRQAVSKHLAVLERSGLISRRTQGREVLYRVETDRLDQATNAMAELARKWDRRLDRIKRLSEAAHPRNKERNGDQV